MGARKKKLKNALQRKSRKAGLTTKIMLCSANYDEMRCWNLFGMYQTRLSGCGELQLAELLKTMELQDTMQKF